MTGYAAISQCVHCSGSPLGLPGPRGTAGPLQGGERGAAWMRPPCGSFAHLSASISNVPPSLPLKTSAGRCQCLAGDFPERSGVAGQAAEQHPGAADHGGHSVGAADPGLRARSGAPDPALAAGPGRRGCDRESQRPAGRTDVRGPGGAPGIQLLLADTGDATTGETRLRWSPGRIGTWRPGTRPRRRAAASPARGSAGHVQAAAAGVAQRPGDAVRVQPDRRVPSSVHARRPGLTSL
jgi:hypothetical protein